MAVCSELTVRVVSPARLSFHSTLPVMQATPHIDSRALQRVGECETTPYHYFFLAAQPLHAAPACPCGDAH